MKLVLFFCLFCLSLNAAAAGTHVVLAQLWFDKHGPVDTEQQKKFLVGTLYPDIRYLGTISRKDTHQKGVTEKKILHAKNLFDRGKKLHCYVDEKREKFVLKCGVLSHLKEIPKHQRIFFLKLLEDEILWNQGDWQLTQEALSKIYQEEIYKGVTEDVAKKWHKLLTEYFNQRPVEFLKLKAEAGEGFLKIDLKTVKKWIQILPKYAADPYFINYTNQMVNKVINSK